MEYRYTHIKTRSAIGYFACLPASMPDLDTALTLLASRQHDKFLHRYCLELLMDAKSSDLPLYAKKLRCFEAGQRLLADVVIRRPEMRPHAADNELELRRSFEKSTSVEMPPPFSREERQQYHANVHQHLPIRLAASDLRACEKQQGLLASRFGKLAARSSRPISDSAPPKAQGLKSLYDYANHVLAGLGIVSAQEMRHEASLSPIALLREWNLDFGVELGSTRHTLKGVATAYGRGISLAQAKITCIMEIVERASAFARVSGSAPTANGWQLTKSSRRSLKEGGRSYILPRGTGSLGEDLPIYWRAGEDCLGREVFAPAQSVYLFMNLEEPEICEPADSTGLGAGQTNAQAKLAALTEVLERYAHATSPFVPGQCFQAASRDPVIQSLLDDYRWRGIHVQFQDITTELGVPSYRCFVKGLDGSITQATGSNLSGKSAALAAMTETPWPYSWATSRPSPSARAPADMPIRFLEDLPDYSSGNNVEDLGLLEGALLDCGLNPVYIDLTRPDISLPVFRCLLPELETDTEFETNTGAEFAWRLTAYQKDAS